MRPYLAETPTIHHEKEPLMHTHKYLKCSLMSISILLSNAAYADNVANTSTQDEGAPNLPPPVAWYDQNGQQVSQQRLEEISTECQLDNAADDIANATSETFEKAYQDFLQAVACFNQYHFISKPLSPSSSDE
ncbi:hypothetical protein VSF3289_01910 [Vibrio scophthalmi]|uniref:Uncharacterized protein n=2 Tax=Vibrio scophthalmi TaxID=45658 RepID=A0A1E3WPE9_9VIBR|nr:hypothetical protein VSF3289_01910 [Vibrio scophthalmi]